jgi:hypothetical protein
MLPDDVQPLRSDAPGRLTAGPSDDRTRRARRRTTRRGGGPHRLGPATGDRGRGGRPLRHGRDHRPRRAPRRAGGDHLQGQRPDLGSSSAGLRRPRAQRDPGGELVHERVRPAHRLRASFSNHTGIAPYKPIIQIDRDPGRSAATTRWRSRARRCRRRPPRSAPGSEAAGGSTSGTRSPSGGRSGAPRRPAAAPTTAPRPQLGDGVRQSEHAWPTTTP